MHCLAWATPRLPVLLRRLLHHCDHDLLRCLGRLPFTGLGILAGLLVTSILLILGAVRYLVNRLAPEVQEDAD